MPGPGIGTGRHDKLRVSRTRRSIREEIAITRDGYWTTVGDLCYPPGKPSRYFLIISEIAAAMSASIVVPLAFAALANRERSSPNTVMRAQMSFATSPHSTLLKSTRFWFTFMRVFPFYQNQT